MLALIPRTPRTPHLVPTPSPIVSRNDILFASLCYALHQVLPPGPSSLILLLDWIERTATRCVSSHRSTDGDRPRVCRPKHHPSPGELRLGRCFETSDIAIRPVPTCRPSLCWFISRRGLLTPGPSVRTASTRFLFSFSALSPRKKVHL